MTRGALHEELTMLQSQHHTIETHARRGLILQPIGVVDGTGTSKVVPIEAQITRPAMSCAPELGTIPIAAGIEMIGQDAHLLIAVQTDARCPLVLVAQVAERCCLHMIIYIMYIYLRIDWPGNLKLQLTRGFSSEM